MYVDDDLAAFHFELWLSYWKSCNNWTVWGAGDIPKQDDTPNTNSLCINCLHILFIIPYDNFENDFLLSGTCSFIHYMSFWQLL